MAQPKESIERFLGIEPPRRFAAEFFVDPKDTGRTVVVLQSLVERAVKVAFRAMVSQQVPFADPEQEIFFDVISSRVAAEKKQYSDAKEILVSFFKEIDDEGAAAAFERFERVTWVRNRIVHGAFLTYSEPIEKLSEGTLTFADLWPATEAVVKSCYAHFLRVPAVWEAMAHEADAMEGYEAWRGK